jgi:hypothetical protein
MSLTRCSNRLLILLLLFALQGQALAAVALACAHAQADVMQSQGPACPYHLASSPSAASDDHSPEQNRFDCQKCSLISLCSVYFAQALSASAPSNAPKPIIEATPLRHFYRFISDLALRPPIAAPS